MSPILVLILSLLCISRAAVITTEKPKGCMYDGKYYEPGLITKTVHGSCVSEVTCDEGGGVMVGDTLGCWDDRGIVSSVESFGCSYGGKDENYQKIIIGYSTEYSLRKPEIKEQRPHRTFIGLDTFSPPTPPKERYPITTPPIWMRLTQKK